jgi:diguanylate cyclase (GGDEF)-like protein
MNTVFDWIAQSRWKAISVPIILVAVIGIIDFWTGFAFSVSFLYIIPVTLATWLRGWRFGITVALIGATIWSVVQYVSGFPAPSLMHPFWNTAMRFGVLATIAYTISYFKIVLDAEMRDARLDQLTGIANRREFLRTLESELNRTNHLGRPLAVAYLDLDYFKELNDTQGHSEGDRALRVVGDTLRRTCRKMDLPARIGGDEFALLLPETDDTIAHLVIERFRQNFSSGMTANQWSLGVSIGVVSLREGKFSAQQVLRAADVTMYKAKTAGRDRVHIDVL